MRKRENWTASSPELKARENREKREHTPLFLQQNPFFPSIRWFGAVEVSHVVTCRVATQK